MSGQSNLECIIPRRFLTPLQLGHTYERSAIARWLKTSDKSPLSGSLLPHKDLVPNYVLLSSLQEAASRISEAEGSQTDSEGSGRTETA